MSRALDRAARALRRVSRDEEYSATVKVGNSYKTVGPFPTREEAARRAFALNPRAKEVSTGYGYKGTFNVIWHRAGTINWSQDAVRDHEYNILAYRGENKIRQSENLPVIEAKDADEAIAKAKKMTSSIKNPALRSGSGWHPGVRFMVVGFRNSWRPPPGSPTFIKEDFMGKGKKR